MPKLHEYRNRPGCYILTSIKGVVVTFQLTADGERKLKSVGIKPEDRFQRALLLDLYRSGDAYTAGSGVSQAVGTPINQLELDFPQDSDPETAFPSCADCAGVEDLHLSILREQGAVAAKLQCPHCRDMTSHTLDTCVPLRLLSLALLGRLFEIKDVVRKHDSVNRIETLLRTEFESKWEELRKLRRKVS